MVSRLPEEANWWWCKKGVCTGLQIRRVNLLKFSGWLRGV